jgi:PleD family two-component response regulator
MTTFCKAIGKTSATILCVDDDDDDASLMESAVLHCCSEIKFMKCFGGKEALDFLNSPVSSPDAILLDVNMPLVNGFDCLKEIQRNPRLRSIPVFMISTSASPKDVTLAMELGARKFLTKPNTYSEICAMVNFIIEEIFALK